MTELVEYYPLRLAPLETPSFDPGEHPVIDAEGARIFSISGNRERAEAIVATLNAAGLLTPAARTQEPVAWRTPMVSKDHYQLTSYADVAEQWRRNGASVEPLYATPQPPAAQGEVERRRNQLAEVKRLVEALPCECDGYHRYECGKHAIERALEAASPDHAQQPITTEYQSLSALSQEWLAKARQYDEYAKQEDISDEEASLYRNSAENYRACEERIRPFIAAGAVVVEPPKPQSNINECPSCRRMFVDGETCPRGGCPMGGDF